MIRCIVVDDKPLAIDVLLHYIAKVPSLNLVLSTVDPMEALNKVIDGEADLVFLDIQMPELSGLQFMKIVKGKCLVVLTTAYPEYALDGFENDAVDYLLKPVSFERFYKAVEKVQRLTAGPAEAEQPAPLASPEEKTASFIFVKTEYKLVRVDMDDIIYVEGLQNYVVLHTTAGKIITQQTMKKTEEQLPSSRFVRIHKSFIVAVGKIDSVERNRVSIAGRMIALGEVYREVFYNAIAHK